MAGRIWLVSYVYLAGDGGPKGRNTRLPDDPDTFIPVPLAIDGDYSKSNFFKRQQGDLTYAKRPAELVTRVKPDVILSGNTPTECQEYLVRASARTGAQFICNRAIGTACLSVWR